jgi:hypothetical protein
MDAIEDMRRARITAAHSEGGRITGERTKDDHDKGTVKETREKKTKRYATYQLTEEDRRRGGQSTQGVRNTIVGMTAITNALQREEVSGVQQGDLRPDVIIDVTSNKTGVISDLHWPFHALYRDSEGHIYGPYIDALEHLRDEGIGTLVINGDAMDCYNISAHERIEKKRDFSYELDVARAMLHHIRGFFGDGVRIIYREGNHEERFERYLAGKANQLQGVVSLRELLRLNDYGVEWCGERAKLTVGKLWIDHGHEWFGSGGVNPARAYRMKAQDNILVGHVHRTTFDMHKRPLDGSLFAGWSMGCLCDLNPHYAPRNHWNHGVVTVDLDGSGEFTVNNRIIIGGRIR